MKLSEKFFKPSTRAFWKAARQRPGGGFWEALHGLIYLKWPETYIKVGLGRSRTARMLQAPIYQLGRLFGLWNKDSKSRFADTYHGKAVPLEEASRLILIDRPVNTEIPEKVLPYSLARDIILENPADLALLNCPCRATAAEPCQPADVCIIAGQPFVDFVLEHHPEKSRRVTVDEAVRIVREEQKHGHVSHAFFKEAVLGRYYAICNCCPCCCGAMEAYRNGVPMLASSGYVAAVEYDICTGCGICAKKCPFAAIRMETHDNSGRKKPVIDTDACLGCGVCTFQCHAAALRLEADPLKPAPLRLDAAAG